MIYLISQISVVLLTKITPDNFFAPCLVMMNRNDRGHLKGSKALPGQRGRTSARERLCGAAPHLCSRGPGSLWVLPWLQRWEWGRGRCDLLLGNLLTSECSLHLHTVPGTWENCQRPKGCMTLEWSANVTNGPRSLSTDGKERYYQAPPAPPVLTCKPPPLPSRPWRQLPKCW